MNARTLLQRVPRLQRVAPVVGRAYASTSTKKATPSPSSSKPPSPPPSSASSKFADRIDPASIVLGQQWPQRMEAHYRTIEPDLLYLLYDPHMPILPDPAIYLPKPDPENPYEKNRPTRRLKGGHHLRPNAKPVAPETLPKLEKIVLHSFVNIASGNRTQLLPVIAAFRAISGSTRNGGNVAGMEGVQICYSKQSVARWKLRPNHPMAVKVEMRGEQMWNFLNSLVEFVIPRLRDFRGFLLPSASSSPNTPNNISGTVSVGFPPTAMGLFPQVEVNFDAYHRMHGFHVQFVTDQRGKGAQDRARQMLSAFRLPFVRR